ncbi:MAG: dTDP-4-dehydrorhamnose 3,5-epimerase [Alphaproteobacteria bacterium]
MKVMDTALPGVKILEPAVFGDDRGFFFELWNRTRHGDAGLPDEFVQDNVSRSGHGTLRGLHYQYPTLQGKLVTVLFGSIFDVVVDIRRGSPHFGQWVGVALSDSDRRQIWAPRGFAHGFVVTSDRADVLYKVDDAYRPDEAFAIAWDDPALAIDWPVLPTTLSDKDRTAPRLADAATLPIWP